MGQGASSSVSVEGSVAPGYESVKEMFEHNFRRGAEESAQLCVEKFNIYTDRLWICGAP